MAGLWSHNQQIQSVAWILVFSFFAHHGLASLQQQQQQQSPASAVRWGTSVESQSLPSSRHILRRSVANAKDSASDVEVKKSHNFTDVNILSRNTVPKPSLSSSSSLSSLSSDTRMFDIPNNAEAISTEIESSGNKEATAADVTDSTPALQEDEYLKTKSTNPDPVEDSQYPSSGTERTKATISTQDPDIDNVTCPECVKRQRKLQKLDPEALRHLRIENIKMQILSKLRFDRPPNVTRGEMNIPAPLSEGQFGGGEEELIDFSPDSEVDGENGYYAKTTQVIITAKDERIYCPTKSRNAGCFEFDLSQATGMHVISAELWVYRTGNPTESSQNQTLVVSQLASRHSRIKKELVKQSVSLHEAGWVTFDMKHKVQNMINHSQRHQRLEVFCEDCDEFEIDFPISSKTGYKPFLAISTSEPSPRRPRSIDCKHGTTDCCRERFYVSFAEIEWDWIIQPKGYHANYCKGSCTGAVIPGYAHTSVIHGVMQRDDHMSDMSPCCAPKETKGISLIYYDSNELIYRRDLPDMVIESCACS